MEKLKFLSTVSAEEFKEQQGITKLDIFRNEKTGKSFMAWGNERGAVYSKYPSEPLKEPMVSEVETSTGERFFMLHNKGDGNATKLQSL
jgi:streptomycin 6-kinase